MRELSLSILDLVQNSLRSGATLIKICVTDDELNDTLSISIKDNGCGMDEDTLKAVSDPFYTTCVTHKVGLGLPLFRQRAVLTGGRFEIVSKQGSGTTVFGFFDKTSIDYVPLGDIASVLQSLIASDTGAEFVYSFSNGRKECTVDTAQLFSDAELKRLPPIHKATIIKEIITANSFSK